MATRDRLRGTLDVLILNTLADGPRHGYSICRWLETTSDDELRVEEGSLYPALYRLEARGLIRSRERMSELGRPAKFYELTAAGRRHLAAEAAEWLAFARTVTRLLKGRS
jgi:PadR family transcriptional regulator